MNQNGSQPIIDCMPRACGISAMTTAPKTSHDHSASSVAEYAETGNAIERFIAVSFGLTATLATGHLTD